MKLLHRGLLAAVLLGSLALVESPQALAQSSTRPMPRVVAACGTPPYTYTAGNYEFALQDQNGNQCIGGSITASLAGFTPGGTTANLAVTTTSADVALPAGTVVKVVNWGATDVHFRVTVGAGTAVTTDEVLKAGAATGVTVGSNTHLSAITDSSTSSLSLAGGSGLVSGYGGGGSTSGGATAALQTTGNTSAASTATNTGTTATGIGAPGDTTCASDSGTCGLIAQIKRLLASLTTGNGSLATIATNSGSSVPGGTNDIGSVQLWAQPASWVSGTLTSAMTGTTDTSLIAAPGANLNNYLVTIVCGNAHATVSTGINIKDGSGGTVIGWVPAAAVYGGTAVNFNVPLKQPTANTALYVADDTTGASVKCTATGFKR